MDKLALSVKFVEAVISLEEATKTFEDATLIRQTEKKMAVFFKEQGRLLLEALPSIANLFPSQVSESAADEIDTLFDAVTARTTKSGEAALENVITKGLLNGYNTTATEYGLEAAFKLAHPEAVAYAKTCAAEKVTGINKTTKQTIHNMVVRGVQEGKSYDQVAREINKRFTEFAVGKPQEHIASRGHLVAINENAEAFESGARGLVNDIEDVGIKMEKCWAGPMDDLTSDGCIENIDIGWIAKDEPFPSGDQHPPRFPGCRHHTDYRVAR